jgi:hypothetical protein
MTTVEFIGSGNIGTGGHNAELVAVRIRPDVPCPAVLPDRTPRMEDMALQLATEEPEAGPWHVEPLSSVVDAVTRRAPDRSSVGRPAVLAVDARSNNGKSTLASVPDGGRWRT